MADPLNVPGVRGAVLKQGPKATESTAYFWGNLTQEVQDSTKSALTIDIGHRAGVLKLAKISLETM